MGLWDRPSGKIQRAYSILYHASIFESKSILIKFVVLLNIWFKYVSYWSAPNTGLLIFKPSRVRVPVEQRGRKLTPTTVWMQVLCTGDGTVADGAGCAEQVR